MSHKDVLLILVTLACLVLGLLLVREYRRRLRREGLQPVSRILFPFDERTFSTGALDASLRIARAENAELVAVYLAVVPMRVSLEAAQPRHVKKAMPLLDEVEARAHQRGVRVDSSIEPGRSYRHALKLAFGRGEFERVIVAAASNAGRGFDSDDVAWMLDHTSPELLVLRAAPGSSELLLAA